MRLLPRGDESGNDHGFCIPSNYIDSIPRVSSFRVLVSNSETFRGTNYQPVCVHCRPEVFRRVEMTSQIFIFDLNKTLSLSLSLPFITKFRRSKGSSFCKFHLARTRTTKRYARVLLVSVSVRQIICWQELKV